MLRKYSLRPENGLQSTIAEQSADWAFRGGMNVHSRIAWAKMRRLQVARLVDADDLQPSLTPEHRKDASQTMPL